MPIETLTRVLVQYRSHKDLAIVTDTSKNTMLNDEKITHISSKNE